MNAERCRHCDKSLQKQDRALFVEEEIGRVFCSEACIADYFGPDVERLEQEYYRRLSKSDLTGEEKEKYSHLRWITLQEPDEIWRERTLQGDYRYTLISEFKPAQKPIWCICICLFLRGEPSFLYLAFTTKNPTMVAHYRKGEEVERAAVKPEDAQSAQDARVAPDGDDDESVEDDSPVIDGLASEWTKEEAVRAELRMLRRADDIPESEFHLYESCVEQTLDKPDEVWSISTHAEPPESKEGEQQPHEAVLYHFIKAYPDEKPGIWYIVVARSLEDKEEEIELLDAFPTRDADLVDQYRRGSQEMGEEPEARRAVSRLIH